MSRKGYTAGEFRGAFRGDHAIHGEVKRHRADCELLAYAASHTRGPRYSDETLGTIRHALHGGDGHYYYGTTSANASDRSAVSALLRAHEGGASRVVLTPHQAVHIREGASHIAAHRHELPPGLVRSYADIMSLAVDSDGHKVVDGRSLRVW